jgi:hypothetical protein
MIEKFDKKSKFQKVTTYILSLPPIEGLLAVRSRLIRKQSFYLFRRGMFWQAATFKQFLRFTTLTISIFSIYYFSRNEPLEILRVGKPIAAAIPLFDLYINAFYLLKDYKRKTAWFLMRRERSKLAKQRLVIENKTTQL